MKKNFLPVLGVAALACLCVIFIMDVRRTYAADLGVMPAVIDEQMRARDIVNEKLTLKNLSGGTVVVFPSVFNIDPETGRTDFQPVGTDDEAHSLANWIEVSRAAIVIPKGESWDVPLVIHANMAALPGKYHAGVYFSQGGTRDEANTKLQNAPFTIVNVEIKKNSVADLALGNFGASGGWAFRAPVNFSWDLHNQGTETEAPSGELRIQDGRGAEVWSAPVTEGKTIDPNQVADMAAVWKNALNFGRYKAILTFRYGDNRTVQDETYFWFVPWQKLAVLLVVLLALVAFIVFTVHSSYMRWHEAELTKFRGHGRHEVVDLRAPPRPPQP